MNSPDFEAFGSTRPRGQNSAAASWQRRAGSATELEFNPHNGVHQAIGGNMAVIALSSRDPIFYLHHANIDRLWTAWNARGNANSAEPMWRDFAFNRNFIDGADGSPWDVGVGDSVRRRRSATATTMMTVRSPPTLWRRRRSHDREAACLSAARSRALIGIGAGGGACAALSCRPAGRCHAAVAENDQDCLARPPDRHFRAARPSARRNPRTAGVRLSAGPAGAKQYRRYIWAALHDIEPPLDATTRVRRVLQLP